MKRPFTLLLAAALLAVAAAAAQTAPTGDLSGKKLTPAERAAALLAQMTLEEKIGLIGAERSFFTRPIERLGIPAVRMADGPQGVRNVPPSTLYPCGILTAATWNRTLADRLGRSLGRDARARGIDILLGPGVNIYRSPKCGRNFEYFGEDPFLTAETAVNYIRGVQNEGVIATIKHFAANNQEYDRHNTSSDVDERTLHEIYLPAFRRAVCEAGVGAVMNSYNPLNGVHATEHAWLNIEVLRKRWGFQGILMSDWTSVYSAAGAANGGLDLECPYGRYFTRERLLPLIRSGVVAEQTIDEKVFHILRTYAAFGLLDRDKPAAEPLPSDDPESRRTALDLAREGIVLLKNDAGNLPLRKSRLLVMGPNAARIPSGGGSGSVKPFSTVTLYDGLTALCRDKRVRLLDDSTLYKDISEQIYADSTLTEPGFAVRYWANAERSGDPAYCGIEPRIDHEWRSASPIEGVLPVDNFSAVWRGYYRAAADGELRITMGGDDGYRLFVDGALCGGDWGRHSYSSRNAFVRVEKDKTYEFRFEFFDAAGDATAKLQIGLFDEPLFRKETAAADQIVYCAGFDSDLEGEGFDRPFALPAAQTVMIERIAELNDRLTVVVFAGGGVDFSGWSDRAKSILMAWYPGQEGGTALAEILTGRIAPSGKLPISIERKAADNPCADSYAADDPGARHKRITYKEGIFVGYRGYDRSGTAPLYPFGYGLSYTDFAYENLDVQVAADGVWVSFDLRNTGGCDAAETVQIYVGDVESSLPRPVKELKGFEKIFLRRGESRRVRIRLEDEAFQYYDCTAGGFVCEADEFRILVGSSSSDIRLAETIRIQGK